MKKKTSVFVGMFIAAAAFFAGAYRIIKITDKAFKGQLEHTNRVESYFELLNGWIYRKNKQEKLDNYFEEHHYHTIAIYGYADVGQRFYEELQDSNKVKIAYIIDQNADNITAEIPVYKPTNNLPDADVIIVTPVFAYIEIESMLKQLVPISVLSIEDVINDDK